MAQKLIFSDDLLAQISEHSRNCLPAEGCGLIAGKGETALAFLPIANKLKSPSNFRMEPQEQLDAMLWMDSQGMELLAIFHTHPGGPEVPSSTDIAEFEYPGLASVIWTPSSLRAFRIEGRDYFEIPIHTENAST